jgi:hypothetical protein
MRNMAMSATAWSFACGVLEILMPAGCQLFGVSFLLKRNKVLRDERRDMGCGALS